MHKEIIKKTAWELRELLDRGGVSSEDIVRAFIERTRQIDGKIGAFLSLNEDEAVQLARASDDRRKKGQVLGPLDGIPISLKDILADKGHPLTCGSRFLKNFVSPYTATIVERLRSAGAIPWGRTNMDEFAMGSSTEHSAFKLTSNPWNLSCIPGGSSGGSAAAVAASETPLALGSDTGGSVRQPAALCGITGLKPTYGLISRYGLVAFASSLDQVGILSRTVMDTAMVLQIIAGKDPNDSTSCPVLIPDYCKHIQENSKKTWKIGVPKEYFGEGLDLEVRKSLEDAIAFYKDAGCEIVDISLPSTSFAIPTYYVISTAEASSNLARFDGIRYTTRSSDATDAIDIYSKSRAEGFGAEVKRRIILGTYVLSSGYQEAWYVHAQKVRTVIRQDFMRAFESVDVLLAPTSPFPAFKKGEKTDDPLAMYLADIDTVCGNLTGLPCLSIPCGFTKNRLPIGLQLIGKPFAEADLLSVAQTFEAQHDFVNQYPSL
jgi:aspartyl-tRNA(Asn)/glutamyl-tRNA(Gln) amidotransferase subunit A